MADGLEGERIRLVPLSRERHFENCLRWVNDLDVTEWLLISDEPTSHEAESEWFDRMLASDGRDIIFGVELLDGTHIGQSALHQVSKQNRTAQCGTLLDKAFWGKGFGTEASLLRARYAFDVLDLRMLISGYLEGNARTPRMLAKQGFEITGRIPQELWKRGAYRDHVLAVLTAEKFRELHGG
ncbi:MAG: GNAT family N-acetyltransferase [Chthonomonas sp.]|nr:GNAT family N-acetyltransferase [Chthonomonas sp.]